MTDSFHNNRTWLVEQTTPNAQLAIVVGGVDPETQEEWRGRGIRVLQFEEGKAVKKGMPKTLSNIRYEHLVDTLKSFMVNDLTKMPNLYVNSKILNKAEAYEPFLATLMSAIDAVQRQRNTLRTDGLVAQGNLIRNLPSILQRPLPKKFKGIARGKAAIVVGAGPSLDASIKFLQVWAQKCIIIAADSAYHALLSHGIEPDLTVNIDPRKTFESCGGNATNARGLSIVGPDSHPSWVNHWPNHHYMSAQTGVTTQWLAQHGCQESELHVLNNAGLTGIKLACWFDCQLLLLVGMDCSIKADGSYYARVAGRGTQPHEYPTQTIPGNIGNVQTPFLSDWQETSRVCAEEGQKRSILHIVDGGAKLEGTQWVPPQKWPEIATILNEFFETNTTAFDPNNKVTVSHKTLDVLTSAHKKIQKILTPLHTPTATVGEQIEAFQSIAKHKDASSLLGAYFVTIMYKILEAQEVRTPMLREAVENALKLADLTERAVQSLKESKVS